MNYMATVKISTREYERVNRLLAIPSLSELSDEELRALGANTDVCEGIYYVTFDDGSALNYGLCCGTENYFDDVIWTDAEDKSAVFLECTYKLQDDEFEINGNTYSVKIEIIEEGNN